MTRPIGSWSSARPPRYARIVWGGCWRLFLDRRGLESGIPNYLGCVEPERGIGGALVHHHMRAIGQSDPAFGAARQSAQQSLPDTLPSQALIPAIDRAPGTEAIRQVTPRSRISQPEEQRIEHHVQSCWRSASQLQGILFLSRFLSGPHHVKRCVFIDFTLYSTTTVLPINRFSNTA